MRTVDDIFVVKVSISNMWSIIKGRIWGHEEKVGPKILLGKDKRWEGGGGGGHPTKRVGLFEILGITGKVYRYLSLLVETWKPLDI